MIGKYQIQIDFKSDPEADDAELENMSFKEVSEISEVT